MKEKKQQDSQIEKSSESSKSRKRPSKRKRKKLKTQSEERICVRFKGLGNYVFKVYCDRRQLPIFRLFATDWETNKKLDKESKSSLGFFGLRSAKLIWREDEQLLYKKGGLKQANSDEAIALSEQESIPPWKSPRLYLHCSIDPDLLTAEGIEKVQPKKLLRQRKLLIMLGRKKKSFWHKCLEVT